MGDGHDGAAPREAADGLDDPGLGVEVDLTGGLVEDEQGAIGEEGARQGDALRLTAGQSQPLLPQEGVQALGHAADLVGQARGLQGPPQALVGGAWVGQAEVVGDGAGEQPGGLGDDGAGGADGVLGAGSRGGAGDAHGSGRGQQVPADQGDERRFARSGGSDDGDALAGLHGQIDAGQNGAGVAGGLGITAVRMRRCPRRPGGPVRSGPVRACPGRSARSRRGPGGPGRGRSAAGPGGRHARQHERGPVVVRRLGDGRQAVVGLGAAAALDGQQAAHDALVGHAPHAHVEEGAHVVEGLEEHIAHQCDGDGVARSDGARGQSLQGHADGGGDEEQGEQAVGDEDDELVAGQQAHDRPAVVLPRAAQADGPAARGPGEGEGGQSLNGVEVLGGEPEALGARPCRGPPESGVEADDGAGHEDDGDREHGGRRPVDRDGEQHQDERRGQGRGDRGGQEGLPVQRHALGAVGQQGDGRPGAALRGMGGTEGQEVVEQARADRTLLLGGAGAGDRLDGEAPRADDDGGRRRGGEMGAPVPGTGAGQERAEAAAETDEGPSLGEAGDQGEGGGHGVGAPPGGRADAGPAERAGPRGSTAPAAASRSGADGLRCHGAS